MLNRVTREATVRRAFTVPAHLLAFVLAVLATPVLMPAILVADLIRRRRFVFIRSWFLFLVYLWCESWGIVLLTAAWFTKWVSPDRYAARNYAIVYWWARTFLSAFTRLFGMRVEVEGAELAATGPFVLLSRHVSPVDNLLPAVFIGDRHGLALRTVMNRFLLRDPCLDIIGNRLPNALVRAGSEGSLQDLRKVIGLAQGLGPRDAIVIFPEGALASPARRAQAVAALREGRDPELAERAARFRHVIPPHLGGTVALLNAAPGIDVVFCAHTGLERANYRHIAAGGPVRETLRVKFWRVPAAQIPAGRGPRSRWLMEQWEAVDRWISQAAGGEAPAPVAAATH